MVKEIAMQQTEIGLIPEDWEVVKIGDVTKLLTNGFVGIAKPHYTESSDGITYVQGFNVEENSFNYTGIKKVTKDFHNGHLRSCLKYKDLLTVQTGDVGLTTFVPMDLEGANCHALIISRFVEKLVESKFVSFYLNSQTGRNRLKDIETGTTMKHINVGEFQYFQIPLPPLPEQEAIAEALSDCDSWIDGIEQLLAKKRGIKQGAMQELLTPKEDWEVKKLGEIFKLKQGVQSAIEVQSLVQKDGFIRFVRIVDVTQSGVETRYIKDPGAEHHISNDDLFMVRYGAPGVIGHGYSGVVANNLFRIIPKQLINNKFFKHYFIFLKPLLEELSSSSTMAALNFTTLNAIDLSFPPLTEQTRIASILSDMDAELEALGQKLAKARQLKQGMMQELLTGKTRLL